MPQRVRVFLFMLLIGGLLGISPGRASAQVPATIQLVTGTVQVSIQGGAASPAAVGNILNAGDTLRTGPGSEAVIQLSDGSTLQLGENSSLDISTLAQNLQTGSRTSYFKLLFGKVRALISEEHKIPGSEFNVETPNAIAGVKFTIFTTTYDPILEETTVETEVGEVLLTAIRRLECPSVRIEADNTGIVRTACPAVFRTGQRPSEEGLQELEQPPQEQPPAPQPLPERPPIPSDIPDRTKSLSENLRARFSANTSSSTPISSVGRVETPVTSSPPPSNQRPNPARRPVSVRVIIDIQKHKR